MKPIFSKGPSLGIKLIVAVGLSLILILGDGRNPIITKMRSVMETGVSSLLYISNAPSTVLDSFSTTIVDSDKLQLENQLLKRQLLEKNAELLLYDQLKVENQRLRLLLNSPLRKDEFKKIAEVMSITSDPYRKLVVINKGQSSGIFVGQPVIDDKGLVGQVISLGATTSRVLLLTDPSNSTPVQDLRSDVRVIATGDGDSGQLHLDNVPRDADIQVGDMLVTSGLGGRYPEGYPVAKVISVERTKQNYFATIVAKPLASLERLRHVLLLWPVNSEIHQAETSSAADVRSTAEKRLSQDKTSANNK